MQIEDSANDDDDDVGDHDHNTDNGIDDDPYDDCGSGDDTNSEHLVRGW